MASSQADRDHQTAQNTSAQAGEYEALRREYVELLLEQQALRAEHDSLREQLEFMAQVRERIVRTLNAAPVPEVSANLRR